MTDYHLLAILPPAPELSISEMIQELSDDTFVIKSQPGPNGDGIRLELDDGWGAVAWLEDDDESEELIHGLADTDLPANRTADDLLACKRYLSVWSDDDPDFMNGVQFEEMLQFITSKLGGLIFDNRLGEWR